MDESVLAEVIRRAQDGEPAAFDRLVDAYADRIGGFLLRLTASADDAEDLTQEVFVRLVRMIGGYQHDGRFEPWLFRIAANLARDRIRRRRRSPIIVSQRLGDNGSADGESGGLDKFESPIAGPDDRLRHREDMDALNAALRELPEGEREVILLRHFSQMSFKEIASAMGTPLGTALARAHRGIARLRELMTGEEAPVGAPNTMRPDAAEVK